jgi:hypothetical protein
VSAAVAPARSAPLVVEAPALPLWLYPVALVLLVGVGLGVAWLTGAL